jgi:hypothetical protein
MEYFYFGNIIKVTEDTSRGFIRSELTDIGKEKLNELNYKELLLYFTAITECGEGLTCLARDFTAFKTFTEILLVYLKETPNPKAVLKDRYDIARESAKNESL